MAPEQGAPPPLAAATMGGGGLEVVNNLVQQMIGGLLGQPSSGAASPLSPASPRGRPRPRRLNGLEAVHGFLNAVGELNSVDDPPALLPVARSGVPVAQSGYQSVTQATTAIIREHERLHGSLQGALAAATNSQNIDAATVSQISALLARVDEAHIASRASAATAANEGGAPGSIAPTAAGEASGATASPLGQAAAPDAEAPTGHAAPGVPQAAGSQHVQEQLQLAVLAYALTMARSAQCIRRFTERMTDSAQQLAQEVVREIAAGEQTFPASQVCFRSYTVTLLPNVCVLHLAAVGVHSLHALTCAVCYADAHGAAGHSSKPRIRTDTGVGVSELAVHACCEGRSQPPARRHAARGAPEGCAGPLLVLCRPRSRRGPRHCSRTN